MSNDLSSLLLASLQPASRKQAEQSLTSLSAQPGFIGALLQLVLGQGTTDRSVRLAASVYLKNVTKLRWDEDVNPIAESDKVDLRKALVPAMLHLSAPGDKTLRAQVAESVSLIAELDFPERWPDLIDQLTASLSPTNTTINISVLETAHSIFAPWRAHVRSDTLFSEINYVLGRFMDPFLQLFRHTANLLLPPASAPQGADGKGLVGQLTLLLEIYYDFTCQDLPPAIEDGHEEFFGPEQGWFVRILSWEAGALGQEDDEEKAGVVSLLKTRVLEIAELYIKLYPDQLMKLPSVAAFVTAVWALVGAGKLPGVGDDGLVSQSLRFISTAIRSGYYKDLFGSKATIDGLVQGVVVPNVGLREHEMEQFEDDPLEFIRLDLALPVSGAGATADVTTRRQAAADVLQALVGSGYEAEATEIVGKWIGEGLTAYQSTKGKGGDGWKAKDSAVYLLTAVATRGGTAQHGVTSTNSLVDVVKFFSDHVFEDLQAAAGTVEPILQVDAIRYLYTFRNQLTKEQLLSVLPLLVRHLGSENYVCYTYAAITIDRVLFIKKNNKLLFTQTDIHEIAPALLDAILSKIESAGTPEKVAENDHLMKCAMRVIVTARQTLTPGYERTLARLVGILGVISKNPSNPHFDQYIFESIAALMRFVVSGSESTLPTFEAALFGPFTIIIQQEIEQYIPYVFQILAQMLELHKHDAPADYRSLLPFLLQPAIWQQKGSVPGLVKLLKAFLARDAKQMIAAGQVAAVLGILQQRLIPSKVNDGWGMELLQSVVQNISPADLKPYFRPILINLLTRLQTSKTDKFVYLFSYFLLFTMAIQVEGLTPDYLIGTVEEIQPQLWSQVLNNFVAGQIPKVPIRDQKVVVVGLTRMLTQSTLMMQEPSVHSWPKMLTETIGVCRGTQFVKDADKDSDPTFGLTEIDHEEQNAGYQAAYSRLAASEAAPVDPVAWVSNPTEYLGQELVRLSKNDPRVKSLLTLSDGAITGTFLKTLASAGLAI
ncbi:hypothetical protein HWV62_6681 [Athelia sp. TMB]|nr:hypothetical protein HWV62_6681 [Athelia sp. TMB]